MNKASPKTIGAFVLGGLVLFLGGIVTLGSFTFFKKQLPVVMYFEGDMTGLDEGAPLVFRGVRIGTITGVSLVFDTKTLKTSIPVHAVVEPDRFVVEGAADPGGKNVPLLIKEGLRAQLAAQSLLTGKLLVRLDMFPDEPAEYHGPKDSKMAEIPTVPSAMAELQEGITGVMKKIEQMPLPEIAADLRKLVRDIDSAVLNVDTKSIGAVGQEAQQLLANLNGRVDTLAPTADSAMKNADQAIVELRKFLADTRPLVANAQRAAENASRLMTTANDAIDPNSPAYRELVATLREFSNSARSIRALTDDLERNPYSILFGKASARGSAR